MNQAVLEVLYRINVGREIENTLLEEAMLEMFHSGGEINEVLFGAVFTGLMGKGVDGSAIATMLRCIFKLDEYNRDAVPFNKVSRKVVEYIGSGKKGIKTFNISSVSAIVAASAGACVLKKGSSSTSSVTGSADFMSILGAKKIQSEEKINYALENIGLAFIEIEDIIPKFDHLYGGKFYSPHILSFGLAALVTSLRGDVLLYGLSHPDIELSIKVMKEFGITDAMVISNTFDGIHYMDEMGIFGITKLAGMQNGVIGKTISFNACEKLGLPSNMMKDMGQEKTAKENVFKAMRILKGEGTESQERVIALNAANLLYLSGRVCELEIGFNLAMEEIKSHRPINKLEEYISFTGGDMDKFKEVING